MSSRKHKSMVPNENFPIIFATPDQLPAKRQRRTLVAFNTEADFQAEWQRLIDERRQAETEITDARKKDQEEATRISAAEKAAESALHLKIVLSSAVAASFPTLFDFLSELWQTKDTAMSSRTSKMLDRHRYELLEMMRERRSEVVEGWATELAMASIAKEGKRLADFLRPQEGAGIGDLLKSWSLRNILDEAREMAPMLCEVLRRAGMQHKQDTDGRESRRDRDLIFSTVICMLAQVYSEHSNETQTVLCLYLLACSTSRLQFEVLHHAGLTSSYTKAVRDIKALGEEQLKKIKAIVGEQRLDNKDHFDNGTTATLIPLYDVTFGELSLELNPMHQSHLPILDFTYKDLLPSAEQIEQLEKSMVWHIQDVLFDNFPELRHRLDTEIPPLPLVLPIPVHKTEQFPLLAMHIDESSLDGTVEVLDTIVHKTLKMTEDDVKRHGIILCAGDQLTISLLDKISASRRKDSELLDNIGRWTRGQLGLFHVKIAVDRMIANEHWGTPPPAQGYVL
ncbi:hypothetical protein SCP_0501930 [Sparassis crispa]|uniref:DUF6589 domain-containing protein n=1 Tax=Sparassis crispa TaxID=139825 RepID=A0A401GLT6_9APHY|nr:hypothetical protein SCP_0501930 [Sparassis crispa]GBE83146.1 hypothetical protein SCP_0501930 [Sparassis crispa]